MSNQCQETELKISALGAGACKELFAAYGLALEPGQRRWAPNDERLISGTIGFVGRQLRGTCLLAAAELPLHTSFHAIGAGRDPALPSRLRDWMGELTNQLMGRLKTKLLARGIEVFVTTPIVLSGVHIEPLPRGPLEPTVFSSGSGDVLIWVEVEAEREFALGSERPGRSNGEGDVIFF